MPAEAADEIPARPSGLAVRIAGLDRRFDGDVHVLDGLDLAIAAGEFTAVLGPSGCGKSTLLRLVAGLDQADAGSLRVADGEVQKGRHPHADAIAFVFQEANLLPWRTLQRNVELPLELAGVDRAQRRRKAAEMLARMGLADAGDRYPGQLSGGMRMRGSLARALVTDPRLLLLDEPFAALDEITRQRLDDLVYRLWRRHRFTVMFVTHSIAEAVFLAQRTVMLSRRPATIVSDRAVELPAKRGIELRSTVEFNRQVARLHGDLLTAEGEA